MTRNEAEEIRERRVPYSALHLIQQHNTLHHTTTHHSNTTQHNTTQSPNISGMLLPGEVCQLRPPMNILLEEENTAEVSPDVTSAILTWS